MEHSECICGHCDLIGVRELEPGRVVQHRDANVLILSLPEVKKDLLGRDELAFQARIVSGHPGIGKEGEIRYGFSAMVKPWKIKATV